jgi:hypothetical protein
MEVGPPGSPGRRRAQTAAVSCRSRAGVGSDCGKGPQTAGQVRDGKTNGSEPLLTHRKPSRRHRNRGRSQAPGQRHARGCAGSRGAGPAGCPGGARCQGGVSPSQALARNRRTCRPETDGRRDRETGRWAAARGRTPSGGHREGQSTAGHRGGPARSSGEGPVMGLERRGRAGQVTLRSTLWGRS